MSGSASWKSLFKIYLQPVCLRMFLLGFSAGLPLLLVLGTLGFWLREAGVDLKTIGFMSWLGLAYGCKWLWAPLVDNISLPYLTAKLGQRKAWLSFSQVLSSAATHAHASRPSSCLCQIQYSGQLHHSDIFFVSILYLFCIKDVT